jgi:hypothetical protein
MKKLMIALICTMMLMAAPFKCLADEVERTPLTQTEIVSLEKSNTASVDTVIAGDTGSTVALIVLIGVAVVVGWNTGMNSI